MRKQMEKKNCISSFTPPSFINFLTEDILQNQRINLLEGNAGVNHFI